MKPEQRESLRQDVVRWISSKDFDEYYVDDEWYVTLIVVAVILVIGPFVCVFAKDRKSAIKNMFRDLGFASVSMRRHYKKLAEEGQVFAAVVWMANSSLISGELKSAPALLIAGAEGTPEDENHVFAITQKMMEMEDGPSATPDERIIRAMLDDQRYNEFRVRQLPLTFTEHRPVYLFDTKLHCSAVSGGELRKMPFIPCMVHPGLKPAILPIPIDIAGPHIRSAEE